MSEVGTVVVFFVGFAWGLAVAMALVVWDRSRWK